MAVVLTSHTQSVEEMKAAVESRGQTAVEQPAPVKPTDPQSEQPGQLGDTPAPGSETAPASEPGKPTQETQAKPDDHMSRGKFKSKLAKLEDRVTRLSDDLEIERGDKATVRQKLAEAEAELAKFKAPAEVEKPSEPVKPKRPTLADCDWDNDKYDAALAAYDDELGTYYRAIARKEVDDRAAKDEADRQERTKKDEQQRMQKEFGDRMDAGRKDLPELDERLDQIEGDVDLPVVINDYIFTADHPADLMNFFAKDALESESAELTRIAGLSPLLQVRTLTRLEERLVREREEKKVKPAPTAVAQEAPAAPRQSVVEQPAPPARPKLTPKPAVDPIEPVGSRASAATATLDKAMTTKDYIRLRLSGVNR